MKLTCGDLINDYCLWFADIVCSGEWRIIKS